METINFNLNHHVHVRLTEEGHKQRKAWYNRLDMEPPEIKEDKDGWSRWQAHVLFSKFEFKWGSTVPFETTIRIEVE